jgi:hypothetical protein
MTELQVHKQSNTANTFWADGSFKYTISETQMELNSEMLVYLNHLMWLSAQENFTEFCCCERFKTNWL